MDAKYCLERPAKLKKTLYDLLEQRENARAACDALTIRYGTIRVRTGNNHARETRLVALADLNLEIRRKRIALAEAEKAANALLSRMAAVPGLRRHAALLSLRYCRNLSWQEVLAALCQMGYPSRHINSVYRWHRQALSAADQILCDMSGG